MKGEVYCHYAKDWIALGRARKKCPHCGATLGTGHPVRDGAEQTTSARQQENHAATEQAL